MPHATTHPGEPLQIELLQEKAANLGRLGRRLEGALAALRDYDAVEQPGGVGASERERRRRELLDAAGEALFLYVVQREVTGLTGTTATLNTLRVPREVRLRMAPRSVLVRERSGRG